LKKALNGFFITAIHTDSGKTLASAIIAESLKADYWKPIQCGTPTDTAQIKSWFGDALKTHPEQYFLSTPASPHFAAEQENKEINLKEFHLPDTSSRPLIVEGAGGLLVPLTQKWVLADLVEKLGLPVILVINHYLGALNHSLLTIKEIQCRKIPLAGLVFNGKDFQNAESVILEAAQCPCLLRIPTLDHIDYSTIKTLSQKLEWK